MLTTEIAEGAVKYAMRGFAKWASAVPREDLQQEAWIAVLEAVEEGVIDPTELERRAVNRIRQVMRAAKRLSLREIPVDSHRFTLDEVTD